MTARDEIRIHDSGTKLLVALKDDGAVVDLSNAAAKEITFQRPGKTTFTRSLNLETDGTDGRVYYVFADGELDSAGIWKFQVHVVLPMGAWRSNIGSFRVYDNLG